MDEYECILNFIPASPEIVKSYSSPQKGVVFVIYSHGFVNVLQFVIKDIDV